MSRYVKIKFLNPEDFAATFAEYLEENNYILRGMIINDSPSRSFIDVVIPDIDDMLIRYGFARGTILTNPMSQDEEIVFKLEYGL
jgi:hypothetical protein